MTDKIISIVFEGLHYTWNGKLWYENETFMNPPTSLAAKLDAVLGKHLGLEPRH